MHSSKTRTFLMVYTLYLVIAIAVYASFYFYINNKETNTVEIAVQIEQLKKQNNQMHNLIAMVRDTEEGRERISSFFVDSDRIIEFLETIESLGDNAGVEINVRSINENNTDTEDVKELELNVDFVGSWAEVHHFLILLESIPVKMVVERLTFNELSENEEGEETWRGNVFFKTLQLEK